MNVVHYEDNVAIGLDLDVYHGHGIQESIGFGIRCGTLYKLKLALRLPLPLPI